MIRLLKKIDRDGERWLLLWFYTFVVMVIVIEVIRRFVFAYSSVWGGEAARHIFIYLVWVGAAAGVRDRTHIRIDVITQYVPPWCKAGLYIFGDIATGMLAIVALYLSISPVLTSFDFGSTTQGLRIVKAWFLLSVPFGFSLVLLRVVQSVIRDCRDLMAGRAVFTGNRLFD